jgi:hypothetical protein
VEFYIAWSGIWGSEDVERCKTDFASKVTVQWLTYRRFMGSASPIRHTMEQPFIT